MAVLADYDHLSILDAQAVFEAIKEVVTEARANTE
jgi:hypothetical protein